MRRKRKEVLIRQAVGEVRMLQGDWTSKELGFIEESI